MSVIIRLQNLPWSANALDIRQYFNGLGIPEGGVHIVGGEQGDAFIAFSTDEDARQAFNLNGGKIKEVQVKLMLSSRTEMQKVIEAARNPLAAFMQAAPQVVSQPLTGLLPAAIPAVIPEIKRDESFSNSTKRDKRRSRSRSRDRKDRSRDYDRRDRRRRDRSRSRSRERRRRDRSHSRERRPKDLDRRSKDRRYSEDKTGSSSNSSLINVQRDQAKIGVWEDPVRPTPSPALQQAQALLSTLLPTALATSTLAVANRNGLPQPAELFFNNRSNESWSSQNNFANQEESRPKHVSRFDGAPQGSGVDERANRNNSRNLSNNGGIADNSRPEINRSGRPNRFDSDKPMSHHRPALLDRPVGMKRSPNDYMKNCCIQLQPFYGGYGEIRRFFQGFFIHNTGIKFVNDDKGVRTGIVYIRFANPDGREKALLKNGLRLKLKSVEISEIDDETFDKTLDRYQPEHRDQGRDHNQFPPNSLHRSRDNGRSFNKKPMFYSSIAVEELAVFTKEQDMLKIFSDYPLLSILLVNKQKHVTAYIKFNNSEDSKKAIEEKGGQMYDGKPLKIRPCSDEEFAEISQEDMDNDVVEVDVKAKPCISDCISLSGLPLKTTDRDISDFFSDVAIVPSKIHLITSPLGFTGQAYCEFSSTEDAGVALDKNNLPLGSGIISVSSVTREEMENIIGSTSRSNNFNINQNNAQGQMRPFFPRNFVRGPGPGPPMLGPRGMMGLRPPMRRFMPPHLNPPDMAPPGCTVLMENVPYKAGLDEILEFFDGFEISADNVLRRYNENGTPSGEAKVIFNSADDAYQAIQDCNYGKIRDRKIFLSQC